jgi:hypothetical protein
MHGINNPNGHAAQLVWSLHYGGARLVRVVSDKRWRGMWRLAWADGRTSDLSNLTRIRDAAEVICQRGPPHRDPQLFRWQRIKPLEDAAGTSPMRPIGGGHG